MNRLRIDALSIRSDCRAQGQRALSDARSGGPNPAISHKETDGEHHRKRYEVREQVVNLQEIRKDPEKWHAKKQRRKERRPYHPEMGRPENVPAPWEREEDLDEEEDGDGSS